MSATEGYAAIYIGPKVAPHGGLATEGYDAIYVHPSVAPITHDDGGYGAVYLNPDNTDPTPVIYWLDPDAGPEGQEFRVVGFGFGHNQAAYDGTVLLNDATCPVVSWVEHAATYTDPADRIISPTEINVPHGVITVTVPTGGTTGVVWVVTGDDVPDPGTTQVAVELYATWDVEEES